MEECKEHFNQIIRPFQGDRERAAEDTRCIWFLDDEEETALEDMVSRDSAVSGALGQIEKTVRNVNALLVDKGVKPEEAEQVLDIADLAQDAVGSAVTAVLRYFRIPQ